MMKLLKRHRPSETGAALIIMCLMLTALLGASAAAIDLGSWYVYSSKVQRAADSAALAGAAYLPDQPAKAQTIALAVAAANGFVNSGNISVVPTVEASNNRLSVGIADSHVRANFAAVIGVDHISIQRAGIAMRAPPIELGNPLNVLGTGNIILNNASGTAVLPGGTLNTWSAILGYCTPRAEGDYFAAGHTDDQGNTPCASTVANPSYDANEYKYEIVIPKGETETLYSRDAPFVNPWLKNPTTYWGVGPLPPSPSHDWTRTDQGFSVSSPQGINFPADNNHYEPWTITTSYDISAKPDAYDDVHVTPVTGCTHTFGTIGTDITDPANNASFDTTFAGDTRWSNICTLAAPPDRDGHWILKIQTPEGTTPDGVPEQSYGSNTFSLALLSANISPPALVACNTITDNTCPRVYAKNGMVTWVDQAGTDSTPYLANIDSEYADHTVKVKLFDVGDGLAGNGNWIEIHNAAGNPVHFSDVTLVNPDTNATVDLGAQSRVDISNGFGEDKLLEFQVRLPVDYGTNPLWGTGWWQVVYHANSGIQDTTTWMVSVEGGPIHLVNQ